MSLKEKRKLSYNSIETVDKKPSNWNEEKILQKLANVRKIQKNKVYNTGLNDRQSRQVQNKFRSTVAAARIISRASTLIAIDAGSDKSKQVTGVPGRMTHTALTRNILQGNIHVKHEFEVDIPSINAMCTSDKEGIWIGCWNRNPLSCITYNDRIETKETFQTSVSDLTIMPSGDILFTKFGDCAIKQISRKNGSISTFRGCMPLFPEGIHATKSGDILVTVVDETSFLVNKSTKRKVLKMSNTGKILKDIEYGERGLKLFILPYRITENVNGDICVVNRTGRYLGQIVVLDSEGELKFTYDGNPSLPCTDFIPMGIACDSNGCIIVTDPNNSAIHILDRDGILIQYFETSNIDIRPPLSVCVDRLGTLWVGSTAEGKQSKSKVYALC